jgi:hypothetical protein
MTQLKLKLSDSEDTAAEDTAHRLSTSDTEDTASNRPTRKTQLWIQCVWKIAAVSSESDSSVEKRNAIKRSGDDPAELVSPCKCLTIIFAGGCGAGSKVGSKN